MLNESGKKIKARNYRVGWQSVAAQNLNKIIGNSMSNATRSEYKCQAKLRSYYVKTYKHAGAR